ncbi:Uncharacterized protein DAT39_021680, partial [Clarias magur]
MNDNLEERPHIKAPEFKRANQRTASINVFAATLTLDYGITVFTNFFFYFLGFNLNHSSSSATLGADSAVCGPQRTPETCHRTAGKGRRIRSTGDKVQ